MRIFFIFFTGAGGGDKNGQDSNGNNPGDSETETKHDNEEGGEKKGGENKEDNGSEDSPPQPDSGNGNPPENPPAGSNEVTEAATCDNGIAWPHGYSVINDIKSSTLPRALSGNIRFDHQGFRTSFQMELTRLTEDGIVGTGKRDFTFITKNSSFIEGRIARTYQVESRTVHFWTKKMLLFQLLRHNFKEQGEET